MLAFLLWLSPIQPFAWLPPSLPNLTGKLAQNRSLSAAERLGMPHLESAEDVLADKQGQLYVTNGSHVMRISADNKKVIPFAEIGRQNLGLTWVNAGKLSPACSCPVENKKDGWPAQQMDCFCREHPCSHLRRHTRVSRNDSCFLCSRGLNMKTRKSESKLKWRIILKNEILMLC